MSDQDDSMNPYSSQNMKTGMQIVIFLAKIASVVLTVFTRRGLGTRYLDSFTITFALIYIAVFGAIFSGGAAAMADAQVSSMRADQSALAVWLVQLKNSLQGELIWLFAFAFFIACMLHKIEFWVLEMRGQYRISRRVGNVHPPIELACMTLLFPLWWLMRLAVSILKKRYHDLDQVKIERNFRKWAQRHIAGVAEPVLYVIVSGIINIFDRGLGGFLMFSAMMLVIHNNLEYILWREDYYNKLDGGHKEDIDAREAAGEEVGMGEHYNPFLPTHPALRQRYHKESVYARTSTAEAVENLPAALQELLGKKKDDGAEESATETSS